MPVEDYETIDTYRIEYHEDFIGDWIVEERYEDSEEITRTEIAIKIIQQGLTDLRKALFEIKHPKK